MRDRGMHLTQISLDIRQRYEKEREIKGLGARECEDTEDLKIMSENEGRKNY